MKEQLQERYADLGLSLPICGYGYDELGIEVPVMTVENYLATKTDIFY